MEERAQHVAYCANFSVSCRSFCPSRRYVEAYLSRYYGNKALPLFQNTQRLLVSSCAVTHLYIVRYSSASDAPSLWILLNISPFFFKTGAFRPCLSILAYLSEFSIPFLCTLDCTSIIFGVCLSSFLNCVVLLHPPPLLAALLLFIPPPPSFFVCDSIYSLALHSFFSLFLCLHCLPPTFLSLSLFLSPYRETAHTCTCNSA